MQTILDLVYSPDDGGWYAQESNIDTAKSRVTKRIYPTREATDLAIRSARPERSIWEPWH
jgi:hypothetical protein